MNVPVRPIPALWGEEYTAGMLESLWGFHTKNQAIKVHRLCLLCGSRRCWSQLHTNPSPPHP